MKSTVIISAALAARGVVAQDGPGGGGGITPVTPVVACASLTAPAVPGASVVAVEAQEVRNLRMGMLNGTGQALSFCDVNVTLTHGDTGDRVRIEVWLPLERWNGRFQGTGGGGYLAGSFGQAMAPQVANGYAAASTDAGLVTNDSAAFPGAEVLRNRQLLINFASLSVHEMAIVGKAVVNQFYGRPARFSYWNGCSTGGRQGMMEAQTYPEDFDGILAIAPAINWAKFVPAGLWAYAIMNEANTFVPACVFNALQAATVNACDAQDGAADGMLSLPGACRFNASTMVGRAIACNNNAGPPGPPGFSAPGIASNVSSVLITAEHARIYQSILDGPVDPQRGQRVWYGLLPGASPTTLATSMPFPLAATWVENVVFPAVNGGGPTTNATSAQDLNALNTNTFTDIVAQSQDRFDIIIGTDNPNLQGFRARGGKILTWHGLADQLIQPNGTFDYVQRVHDLMGGAREVDTFYRAFAAPGIQHCAGGPGATPVDALAALVQWVEQGRAPDSLPAARAPTNSTALPALTRNLCRYPQVQVYRRGDPLRAESWGCADGPAQGVVERRTQSQGLIALAQESAAAAPSLSIVMRLLPLALGLALI